MREIRPQTSPDFHGFVVKPMTMQAVLIKGGIERETIIIPII
jgi:hypothetical protein